MNPSSGRGSPLLRQIVSASLRFRLLVAVGAAALLVVGVSQVHKAPVEVLPDFTPTTVEVQSEALGLSAEEVEQLITVPLEQDLLNGIAFLKDIRSESVPGLSRILMVFEPGTSVYKARQVVAERLTQAFANPQVSKPPRMLQPLSSTDRVLVVGMSSKTVSPLQLGVLARWTIAPRLVGVPGVANVAVWGQRDRQLQVEVDPERLRQQGVTLDQVIRTSANALWVSPLTFVEASTPGTGGFIDTANQRLPIQHEQPIVTATDLSKVRVEEANGRKLVLGDVANVVEDHQPLIGDAGVAGNPGLLLVIQRFPGTDLLGVTRGVEKALAEMEPGLAGIDFDTDVYRPATYVDRSIDNVKLTLFVGLGLLALALGLFLFRLRAALIAIIVVPLSALAAVLVLWGFGSTINAMLLAGLVAALVLVIDDAIVSTEHITRRLQQQGNAGPGQSPVQTILEATLEARRPAVYATLIVALATLPIFFLERLSGAFFPDLAVAFLLALLASMVVALVVTPALSALLLSRAPMIRDEPALGRWLRRRYELVLARIVHQPRVAYLVIGALVALTAATAPFVDQKLLPTFKENDLLVSWNGPPGTSLREMDRVTALASRELRAIPGVRDVGSHVGRAITGDQIVGVNSGEIWVNIDAGADYDSTLAAVKQVVAAYPGFSHHVQTYSEDRVKQALTQTDDNVAVRVYGEDLGILGHQAARVRRVMSDVGGITDARVLLPPMQPAVRVRVDLAKADRYGIKPGDVRRAATTLLSGLVVGNLFEEQKVFDVVVWGTPQVRGNLTSVRRLLIDTPEGGHVRLGDVADVGIAPSPAVIKRQAVSRYVDVAGRISGRDRNAVVGDVKNRLLGLRFPAEYHATVLATETQPTRLLILVAIAAVIGMFLLLQAAFESWRLATLSILTLPIGIVGGLVAVVAAGEPLSFGSYVALLALFGLAARGCVYLFGRARELQREQGEASAADLVMSAARERMGPAVTTALAGGLVFLPVLIMGSRPGLELLHPVAVVFAGGLITSTLVSLFVLPVLYLRFGLSGRAEAAEPADLPTALGELARGAAASGSGEVPGPAVLETRAVPPFGSD
ncbi:MAG TPA: efflux RND transporter permease subunit [Gaiellaceae bacterium]|nr:efflux RND transporter permease subunit [Gaiellaceae bacterium]